MIRRVINRCPVYREKLALRARALRYFVCPSVNRLTSLGRCFTVPNGSLLIGVSGLLSSTSRSTSRSPGNSSVGMFSSAVSCRVRPIIARAEGPSPELARTLMVDRCSPRKLSRPGNLACPILRGAYLRCGIRATLSGGSMAEICSSSCMPLSR